MVIYKREYYTVKLDIVDDGFKAHEHNFVIDYFPYDDFKPYFTIQFNNIEGDVFTTAKYCSFDELPRDAYKEGQYLLTGVADGYSEGKDSENLDAFCCTIYLTPKIHAALRDVYNRLVKSCGVEG